MTDDRTLLVTLPGASPPRRALDERAAARRASRWSSGTSPDRRRSSAGRRIDIVVPPYMGAADRLGALDGVRRGLVQSQSIGYDDMPAALPPGHVFANAASVHETSTAELTLALVLAAQRGIPDFVRAAGEGRWAPARHASLADRRVLLVGYGGVGRAIEERLAPFEVELTRVASRARDDERGRIHGIDELPHAAARPPRSSSSACR